MIYRFAKLANRVEAAFGRLFLFAGGITPNRTRSGHDENGANYSNPAAATKIDRE